MSEKVVFMTDTYKDLNIKKDTSILMIEEAINNKFNVFQCEINDLFVEDGNVHASARNIISAGSTQVEGIIKEDINVVDFKFCFMRKDPPVDENYVNALHLLGLAEKKGAVIYNKPNAIKEFNEKLLYEIGEESFLQDIFGLTMGSGDNFWMIDRDQMEQIFENMRNILK